MKKKNERFGEGKKIFKVGLRIIDIIVDKRELLWLVKYIYWIVRNCYFLYYLIIDLCFKSNLNCWIKFMVNVVCMIK